MRKRITIFKVCIKINSKDVTISEQYTKANAEKLANKWKDKGYYVVKGSKLISY